MEHRKLSALLSPSERIAKVAAQGAKVSKGSQTSPSGAKSFDNADGTRTIIGEVQNGENNPSFTMATHVGDETPPGVPTGITASCKSGVVVVEWDGTLDGGIPDDFYCVRIFLDGAELGALTEAGSVSSASLEAETVHSVTATSEDDCCLPDGTPAHNVSDPTAAVSVTVSQDAAGVAAIAEEALTVAEATGQHFWPDDDGIHVTEVTEEEWKDEEGPHFHSGMNVLINSLGQLFRDGLNNLLAIGSSGLAIYDGQGSASSNVMFEFSKTESQTGTEADGITETYYNVETDNPGVFMRFVRAVARQAGAVYETILKAQFQLGDDGFVSIEQNDRTGATVAQMNVANTDGTGNGFIQIASGFGSFGSKLSMSATDIASTVTGDMAVNGRSILQAAGVASANLNLTTTNIGGGTRTLNLHRAGSIITCYYGGALSPSAANTVYTVGTIPSGYRPVTGCFAHCIGVTNNSFTTRHARWRFLANGTVQVICSATGATEYPFGVSWYTNDAWPTS